MTTESEAKGKILEDVDAYGDIVKAPLEAEIADQQQQITTLSGTIATLEQQVADMTAEILALQGDNSTKAEEIVALQQRVAELQALLDACQGQTGPDMSRVGVVTPWQIGDYTDLSLPEFFALLNDLGVKVIRGRWMTNGRGDEVMDLCAQYGIKWLVSFVPESWGESKESRTIKQLQSALLTRLTNMWANPNAEEVVLAVENMNEPNQGRSGAVIRTDWPQMCAAFNQTFVAFRQTSGATWLILSSAMHDLEDDKHDGGDWLKLGEAYAAVDTLPDVISVHSYNGDQPAGYKLEERLARVNAAFPEILPVWVTETGWYLLPNGGPPYTSPEQAAEYMRDLPSLMLDANNGQVEKVFYYELYSADRGLYWNGAWSLPGQALMDMYHA